MAIFLITAPSGAGKTTIAQELQDMGVWEECVSHTTREMREGEEEGKTYYYISKEKFKEMCSNGEFVEQVTYNDNYYGISKEEIERVTKKGKSVFIIVEHGGYLQIKEKYPDAIGIFLYMSKEDCMANMLLRGDSLEKAQERIKTYEQEIKNKIHYDYVIKNVRDKRLATREIIRHIVKQYDDRPLRTGDLVW